MKEVVLHGAYQWECDNCGAGNFCCGLAPNLLEEEIDELRTLHGIEPEELGVWMTPPKTVTCSLCGHVYKTKHFSEA